MPNHTSSAHPWFVDAAASRDAAHRDYYVWADPRPDGGPPNNWLDFTGRPAWQWHESGQYYLHNFLPGQPDLNWWEPAVHREFRDILDFWFERGVAGFRIDVANGLYKDAELRDNPPATSDSPLDGSFGLRLVYNVNRPETHGIYRGRRERDRARGPRGRGGGGGGGGPLGGKEGGGISLFLFTFHPPPVGGNRGEGGRRCRRPPGGGGGGGRGAGARGR